MSKIRRDCKECSRSFFVYPSQVKKGGGKFCSIGCGTTYRNKTNNPAWCPRVRRKISENHADVSGENNPMYGRRGEEAPSYIDGRNSIKGDVWRKIALTHKPRICEICGDKPTGRNLHIHNKDKDRQNNDLDNLQVVVLP